MTTWIVFWMIVGNSASGVFMWTLFGVVEMILEDRCATLRRRRIGLRKQDWTPREDPAVWK